jgi:hypothetical protein
MRIFNPRKSLLTDLYYQTNLGSIEIREFKLLIPKRCVVEKFQVFKKFEIPWFHLTHD